MRASGPLHPIGDDGDALDATFELIDVPIFELVFHHKAGGRDSPRSVNADYHEALELLLARLADWHATILGIDVDSSVARELSPEERELALVYPIALTPVTDVAALRLEITRAQKPVARRHDAKPLGGNDQKRIRMTLNFGHLPKSYNALLLHLVGSDLHADESAKQNANTIGRRTGPRTTTSLAWLITEGVIPSSGSLTSHYRGGHHQAQYDETGAIFLDGARFDSLSSAARHLTGGSVNGWRFWHVERDGRHVPLSSIRDEL